MTAAANLFYDPAREAEAKRRRSYAQQLMDQSKQPEATEMVSGMAVAQSPVAALARALQGGLGAYENRKADDLDTETARKRQEMISAALGQVSSDPQAAAATLGQDPTTSDLALKVGTDKDIAQAATRNRWASALGYGNQAPAADAATPSAMPGAMPMQQMAQQVPGTMGGMVGPGGQTNVPAMAPAPLPSPGQPEQSQSAPQIPPQIMQEMMIRDPDGAAKIMTAQRIAAGQGGATGAIADRLIAAGVDPLQAILIAKSGLGAGNIVGNGGVVSPMSGMTDTLQSRAAASAAGTGLGEEQGAAAGELSNLQANMPKLMNLVNDLHGLGQKATYTYAGQAVDAVNRQLGFNPRESAVARAEYISKIDNNILPLLRQTFGAQFTQKEGESLKDTLGDPNKSPQEKDAVLQSFINQKIEQAQALERQLGTGSATGGQQAQYEEGTRAQGPGGQILVFRNGAWGPEQ